jgi:hypothetical protein
MKVISIWQPFSSLLVKGFKIFETRTWPVPASVVGQTIGIASTKGIKSAQRAYFDDENFLKFYAATAMPQLEDLPCGYLLGTVKVDSCELMTPEFMEEVSDEEQAYGHWEEGNYAWRMTDRRVLDHPIPIRGAQGLFEWNGVLPDGSETSISETAAAQVDQQGSPLGVQETPNHYRHGLRLV